MFTGLVEGLGRIQRIEKKGSEAQIWIKPEFTLEEKKVGESLAVNGVCLTVTAWDGQVFSVDVSDETLRRSNLGQLRVQSPVNLERALRLSDRLGGHLVTGHIDGTGKVLSKEKRDNFFRFRISFPKELRSLIVGKGSITVDGISLTVNQVHESDFDLTVIPHTAAQTTLGVVKIGQEVNLETDLIGKYIVQFLMQQGGDPDDKGTKITLGFLKAHGFYK
jgi:riboflavin synthase